MQGGLYAHCHILCNSWLIIACLNIIVDRGCERLNHWNSIISGPSATCFLPLNTAALWPFGGVSFLQPPPALCPSSVSSKGPVPKPGSVFRPTLLCRCQDFDFQEDVSSRKYGKRRDFEMAKENHIGRRKKSTDLVLIRRQWLCWCRFLFWQWNDPP